MEHVIINVGSLSAMERVPSYYDIDVIILFLVINPRKMNHKWALGGRHKRMDFKEGAKPWHMRSSAGSQSCPSSN
jgi:hypothetical protein